MPPGAILLAPDDATRRLAPRRGLSCAEASDYVGVSVSKFLEMVADSRMPKAKEIDRRRVWDIRALDKYFDMLPGDEDAGAESETLHLRNKPDIVL